MTPADIVKVLTAVAPIAASVVSMANKSENEVIERKETPNVTNIHVTITNHFHGVSNSDAVKFAEEMQNKLIGVISSENRYTL